MGVKRRVHKELCLWARRVRLLRSMGLLNLRQALVSPNRFFCGCGFSSLHIDVQERLRVLKGYRISCTSCTSPYAYFKYVWPLLANQEPTARKLLNVLALLRIAQTQTRSVLCFRRWKMGRCLATRKRHGASAEYGQRATVPKVPLTGPRGPIKVPKSGSQRPHQMCVLQRKFHP